MSYICTCARANPFSVSRERPGALPWTSVWVEGSTERIMLKYGVLLNRLAMHFTQVIGENAHKTHNTKLCTTVRKLLINNDKRDNNQIVANITFYHLFRLVLTVFGPQIACSVVGNCSHFLNMYCLHEPLKMPSYDMQRFITSPFSKIGTGPVLGWFTLVWFFFFVNRWDFYETLRMIPDFEHCVSSVFKSLICASLRSGT